VDELLFTDVGLDVADVDIAQVWFNIHQTEAESRIILLFSASSSLAGIWQINKLYWIGKC
jgi:hypothetical protein